MHYPAQIQKPSAITISLKSVLILTLLLYVLKAIIIDTGVSDAASFLFKPVLAFQGTFPFYNNYNSPTIFANQPITNWIEQCISNNIAVNNKIGMVVPNGFAAYCIQQLQPSSYYQSQIRINLFRQCLFATANLDKYLPSPLYINPAIISAYCGSLSGINSASLPFSSSCSNNNCLQTPDTSAALGSNNNNIDNGIVGASIQQQNNRQEQQQPQPNSVSQPTNCANNICQTTTCVNSQCQTYVSSMPVQSGNVISQPTNCANNICQTTTCVNSQCQTSSSTTGTSTSPTTITSGNNDVSVEQSSDEHSYCIINSQTKNTCINNPTSTQTQTVTDGATAIIN